MAGWETAARTLPGRVVLGGTGTGYAPPRAGGPQRILRNMQNAPAAWISLRGGSPAPRS